MGHRLLFCATSYPPESRGGAEQQAKLQAEELVRRGHSVTVVCHAFGRPGTEVINGVRVVRLRGARGRRIPTLAYGLALAVYLATHVRQYDIVHVHVASLHVHVAALCCLIFRRPLYLKLGTGGSSGDIAHLRPRAWLTRMFGLRRAGYVQAISSEIAGELSGLGIASGRILRIPNGYDPSSHYPAPETRQALRRKLALPADKTIFLYTGRFVSQKGLDLLLAAWSDVSSAEALLVLAGAPTESDSESVSLSALPNVLVRAWSQDIAGYLRAADVFVLPSYAEGMSNSLLEAMACGLAVIATRVGAAEEMIEHGRSGLLVAPGDRAALAQELRRLIEDAGLRDALGRAGAADMPERYSMPRVVKQIERAYQSLLSKQHSP